MCGQLRRCRKGRGQEERQLSPPPKKLDCRKIVRKSLWTNFRPRMQNFGLKNFHFGKVKGKIKISIYYFRCREFSTFCQNSVEKKLGFCRKISISRLAYNYFNPWGRVGDLHSHAIFTCMLHTCMHTSISAIGVKIRRGSQVDYLSKSTNLTRCHIL